MNEWITKNLIERFLCQKILTINFLIIITHLEKISSFLYVYLLWHWNVLIYWPLSVHNKYFWSIYFENTLKKCLLDTTGIVIYAAMSIIWLHRMMSYVEDMWIMNRKYHGKINETLAIPLVTNGLFDLQWYTVVKYF